MDQLQTRLKAPEQRTHTVARQLCWWRGLAIVIVTLATWAPVQAAVFQCPAGDVACLITAINTANADGEADLITLAEGTYTLTAVDNVTDGPNGLPSIVSAMTIQGVGPETTVIERDASAPEFRIVHVAPAGILTLEGLTIRGGTVYPISDGGGVANNGTVTLTNCRVADSTATAGGGLANRGTMSVTNCTIADNFGRATGGGGISNNGLAIVTQSTVVGNRGDDGETIGGGLLNEGTLILTNSTVADNSGVDAGGGISNSGLAILTNSTVADNQGGSPGGGGGGLRNTGTGTLILTNSTVADNRTPAAGAGGIDADGTVTLQNTILARNIGGSGAPEEAGVDCFGRVTSLGHNIIGDLTGCTVTLLPTDLSGDPGLGTFTDDETPGHGHIPLLAASRAINAGTDTVCPRTDQLGQPRVGVCDIGAIEFQQASVPSCQGGRSHIRGRIITAEDAVGHPEVTLTLAGPRACQETATTGERGVYVFAHLGDGTYTVTPSAPACTFDPPSRIVTLEKGGHARLNFAANCP
jgi:hypothetical protein